MKSRLKHELVCILPCDEAPLPGFGDVAEACCKVRVQAGYFDESRRRLSESRQGVLAGGHARGAAELLLVGERAHAASLRFGRGGFGFVKRRAFMGPAAAAPPTGTRNAHIVAIVFLAALCRRTAVGSATLLGRTGDDKPLNRR